MVPRLRVWRNIGSIRDVLCWHNWRIASRGRGGGTGSGCFTGTGTGRTSPDGRRSRVGRTSGAAEPNALPSSARRTRSPHPAGASATGRPSAAHGDVNTVRCCSRVAGHALPIRTQEERSLQHGCVVGSRRGGTAPCKERRAEDLHRRQAARPWRPDKGMGIARYCPFIEYTVRRGSSQTTRFRRCRRPVRPQTGCTSPGRCRHASGHAASRRPAMSFR